MRKNIYPQHGDNCIFHAKKESMTKIIAGELEPEEYYFPKERLMN